MKKNLTLLTITLFTLNSFGQTNPIPLNGNVEIGAPNRQIKIIDTDTGGKKWTIGSSNNTDLSFHFQETLSDHINDVLRLTSKGNIGIGTTNPFANLQIHSTNTDARIALTNNHSGKNFSDGFVLINESDSEVHFLNRENASLKFSTYGTERMRISANGNIGVGVTNPFTNLQIHSTNGDSRIALTNKHSGKNASDGFVLINENDSEVHFLNRENTSLKFSTFGTERMRILANGNIGVGTQNTGSHKFAVEGSIGAREIKVEANVWSDFVFEKEYNLPSLKEVENHIKEKGHLKDIPNAKEVKENGIFLGQMNSKLLQKIEELTLYTIQQEKEIKKLKSINSKFIELEKRLEELEKIKPVPNNGYKK